VKSEECHEPPQMLAIINSSCRTLPIYILMRVLHKSISGFIGYGVEWLAVIAVNVKSGRIGGKKDSR